MLRTSIAIVALAAATVAGVGVLAAQPDSALMAAQSDDETPTAIPVAELVLGERYSTDAWELEVQDAFVADSDDRAAFVEVRASVAFRSLTGEPLAYDWAAFTGTPGYPRLQIVDADNVVYPIDVFEAGTTMVPGSDMMVLDPYVPARWTIGFETNDVQSTNLSIQAIWNGSLVAEWDVFSTPQPLAGWEPPPASEPTSGEFGWSDDLFVTMTDSALLACGDPETQPVFVRFQTGFSVANDGVVSSLFPNVRYPETPAIAIWADGSSAQAQPVEPQFAGVVGEVADEDTTALNFRTHEQLIVPGSSVVTGVLQFDLPRDARFGDVTQYPEGILLYPPNSPPQWISITPGIGTVESECVAQNAEWEGGSAFQVDRVGS